MHEGRHVDPLDRQQPGFISEALPLVLLSMERSLDLLQIDEFADMSSRNSPEMLFELMGFGGDPAKFDPRRFGHIAQRSARRCRRSPTPSVCRSTRSRPAARSPWPPTTSRSPRARSRPGPSPPSARSPPCLRDGKPLLRFHANWYVTTDLEPAWDLRETGWRVQVLGDTPLDVEIRFPVEPERYPQVSPGFTAHPAVNAIPAVCEAAARDPHHASTWAG